MPFAELSGRLILVELGTDVVTTRSNVVTMDVGVRELKAKLSAMLERAAAGEVITVTDRGQPVATLGPPFGAVDLTAAVEAGWLTPATSAGLGPARRHRATAPVLDVLAEDRGE